MTKKIAIRSLSELDVTRFRKLGSGYTSSEVYLVSKSEDDTEAKISLELHALDTPYVKEWDHDEEMESHYAQVIDQGLSLGAYDEGQLVGIAIAEKRAWNRTLWVWEFHIDSAYRRRGLGRQLMDRLAEVGRDADCRVLVCETQNTNVPAIRFYRSVGFEVGAIDLSYYTNKDITDFEVAVFMKRFID